MLLTPVFPTIDFFTVKHAHAIHYVRVTISCLVSWFSLESNIAKSRIIRKRRTVKLGIKTDSFIRMSLIVLFICSSAYKWNRLQNALLSLWMLYAHILKTSLFTLFKGFRCTVSSSIFRIDLLILVHLYLWCSGERLIKVLFLESTLCDFNALRKVKSD